MIYGIILGVLALLAVVALVMGIIGAVRYGKMTGAKVEKTQGQALPTAMGSMTDRMREQMQESPDQMTLRGEKTKYMTQGKEVGMSFSLSYSEMREGLKKGDPKTKIQFQTFAGFVSFVMLTFFAIGVGFLWGQTLGMALLFLGAGSLILFVFIYQMLLGR